jgi:hypothetical protein
MLLKICGRRQCAVAAPCGPKQLGLKFLPLIQAVILNGLQAVKDPAWSGYALQRTIVQVRAKSFGAEVPQDDAGVGDFSKLTH